MEGSPLEGLLTTRSSAGGTAVRRNMLYMLVAGCTQHGLFDDYVQFADELKNLPAALVSWESGAMERPGEYAMKYKDDPYQIWMDPATCGGLPIPLPAGKVLEESQWLRTKSVTS